MKDIHSRRAAEDKLIERASKDEAFRKQLIENPRGTIAAAMGIRVPAEVTVEVLEETPRALYLVLPVTIHVDQELTQEELESVAGGLKEKQESIKTLQAELEEIQADMDSAWGKVKGF